jgi:2-polyprenyl-3-methyl-5-hydroxy-6-metoxy-1,4-benzoquinol methylase
LDIGEETHMLNSQHFSEHEIKWDSEKISRLWNYYSRNSPFSDVYFSNLFGHHMLRHSGLSLRQRLEVLDFGCGPGFIWNHLDRLGSRWEYTGLDFSADSINEVCKKGFGKKYFQGAYHISSLPTNLPSSHFDVVLLFEVVEHLNDVDLLGILEEVFRLLKYGGVLIITTPNEENLNNSKKLCPECGAIFHEWQHLRSWSIASLSKYVSKQGFVIRKAKTLDFAADGLGFVSLLKKIRNITVKLLNKPRNYPHMIAVFQKPQS